MGIKYLSIEANRYFEYCKRASDVKVNSTEPLVVRLGLVSYGKFTKGFEAPYDECVIAGFKGVMKAMQFAIPCGQIMFMYWNNDSVDVFMRPIVSSISKPPFNYEVQQMCSKFAGIATNAFNTAFEMAVRLKYGKLSTNIVYCEPICTEDFKLNGCFKSGAIEVCPMVKKAYFDCKCFNMARFDIYNYLCYLQGVHSSAFLHNMLYSLPEFNIRQCRVARPTYNEMMNLLDANGISLEEQPEWCRYGILRYPESLSGTEEKIWGFKECTYNFDERKDVVLNWLNELYTKPYVGKAKVDKDIVGDSDV